MPVDQLQGRVAVVTGGGSGMGRAFALAFAGEGMHVAVADVDLAAAETVANEVRAAGVKCIAVQTDVSDRAAVENLANRVYDELGGAHVVCNNAGVVTFRFGQDMTEADWDWVLGVNLYGVIHGVEAFLPRMLAAGQGGHFVNTASIAGLVPAATPGILSYTAAKYGVVGLSESLRLDLHGRGIGVTVLGPAGVQTRMLEAGRNRPPRYGGPESSRMLPGQGIPQQMIAPDEVARRVVQAVRRNELYVLTHPETRPPVEARFGEILHAFDELERRGSITAYGPPPAGSPRADVKGKTAVVTGGGSGIGKGMALAFAAQGMNVVVADIDAAAADSVAAEARASGVRSLAIRTDVTDRASVRGLADRAFAEFGSVHVLCNNAGVVTFKNAADTTDADWTWVMSVDLGGVVNGITQFLPRMIRQGGEWAHIVNTSSHVGLFPAPAIVPYVTAKYAVVGISEHLRQDLASLGVGVSVLCPGGVRTQIVNAGRNRPDALGGPEEPPAAIAASGAGTAEGLDPLDVGRRVLSAIQANELYIVTHPDSRPGVEGRFQRILAAYGAE